MTKIPEDTDSVHQTAPGPSEVFTTRESLRERCEVALRCLPQAPMRDMLARLFEDLLADQWLPIETAPQTGYMLVYEDGAIRALFRSDGKWEPPNYPALVSDLWGQNVLVGPDAARVLAPLGFRLEVRDGCCEQPTHWMPLPAAPHHRSAVGAPGSNKPESEPERAMGDPTLKNTGVTIRYTASDGYRNEASYSSKGAATPQAVFIEAVDELSRLCALFGFGDEARAAFDDAQRRVAKSRGGSP